MRLLTIAAVLCSAALTSAQETPTLTWRATLAGGARSSAGTTIDVFDTRTELFLTYTFANENSDRSLTIPAELWRAVRITMRQGTNAFPVTSSVQSATLVDPGSTTEVFPDEPITLPSVGVLEVAIAVRSASGPFQPGLYTLTTDFGSADLLRVADDGAKWSGRFTPTADLTVRVATPTTPDEWRVYHQIGLEEAERLRQPSRTLKHALALVPLIPDDLSVQGALGNAYFLLRRYTDAIPPLERATAPARAEARLVDALAYAYVSTGQEAKAETFLRQKRSTDEASETMARIRREIEARALAQE